MKIFEITKPQNVHQPDAPADQEPEQQQQPKKRQWMSYWKDYDKNPEDFGVKPNAWGDKPHPKWTKTQRPGTTKSWEVDYTYDDPEEKAAYDKATKDYYNQPEYKDYEAGRSAHHKEMEKAKKAHYAKQGRFDATITIANPFFDPNDANDDDTPEEIDVGVDYDMEVSGEDRPATWGYHGGEPPEYAEREVYINRVVDLDTGEDITDQVDHEAIEQALDNQGSIMSASDYVQDKKDQAAIDRYEANRDMDEQFAESVNRIKHLSGLK